MAFRIRKKFTRSVDVYSGKALYEAEACLYEAGASHRKPTLGCCFLPLAARGQHRRVRLLAWVGLVRTSQKGHYPEVTQGPTCQVERLTPGILPDCLHNRTHYRYEVARARDEESKGSLEPLPYVYKQR